LLANREDYTHWRDVDVERRLAGLAPMLRVLAPVRMTFAEAGVDERLVVRTRPAELDATVLEIVSNAARASASGLSSRTMGAACPNILSSARAEAGILGLPTALACRAFSNSWRLATDRRASGAASDMGRRLPSSSRLPTPKSLALRALRLCPASNSSPHRAPPFRQHDQIIAAPEWRCAAWSPLDRS
jgi:hypothetical protein